jgi:hypothetical protein
MIEYKGCSGGLLSLDGELTPEGEAFVKRQESDGSVQFKVVTPESIRADSAQVQQVRQRMAEIQQSLERMKTGNHVAADHPVVRRAMQLFSLRKERG